MDCRKLIIIYLHTYIIRHWFTECFAFDDDLFFDTASKQTMFRNSRPKTLLDFEEQISLEREILGLMDFPEQPRDTKKTPFNIDDLFFDNPSNSTSFLNFRPETLLDFEDQTSLEREILSLMGFPEQPKDTSKTPIRKRSAPNYMLNIYENNQDNLKTEPLTDVQQFPFTQDNHRIINESDVIISFMAEQPHQGRGGKPDRVKRMWFDVSEISEDDMLTYAELRLYRVLTDNIKRRHRGAFKITVSRVLLGEDGEKEFEYIDSVNTAAEYQGWITLNVTKLLDFWTKNPDENRGLYVLVLPIDRPGRRVKPENMGIVGFDGEDEKQPFIAGFYKNNDENKVQLKWQHILKRYKRSLEYGSLDAFTERQFRSDSNPLAYTHACIFKNFYVSFKDIRWHEWIIAPNGYEIHYCAGSCDFPLAEKMNATPHAIMQSYYHLLYPNKVPKPCCAPTRLSSISILYFLSSNNVVYKKLKNMVVDGCGCL